MTHFRNLLFLSFLLFLSVNLSAQWKDIKVPYGYSFKSSFIDQDGNMFLECYDDIYYSDDLGQTWSKTNLPNFKLVLFGLNRIVELVDHRILISETNSVYEFDKVNKTWNIYTDPIHQLINIDHQGRIWYNPDDPAKYGVLLTKDGGQNYQFIESNDPEIPCSSVLDSYQDDLNLMISHCSNSTKLYKFTEAGVFTFLNDVSSTQFLYINQKTGTVFTLNTSDNLCRSIDGGATLIEVNSPIIENSSGFINIRLDDNGDLLLKDNETIYVSKDDGVTWKIFKDYLMYQSYQFNDDPEAIRFVNNTDTVVSLYSTCGRQGVYRSDNNGKKWTLTQDNFYHPYVEKLFEDNAGNLYVFSCSDTSALRSKDGGKTWSKYAINSAFAPVDMASKSNGEIYATSPQGVYKSVNGGAKYTALNVPIPWFWNGPSFNIYPTENGYIYINDVNTGYTYLSKDDGFSWEQINFSYQETDRMQVDANGNIYALTGVGLFFYYDVSKEQMIVFDINLGNGIEYFEYARNGNIYFNSYDIATLQETFYISKDQMKSYTPLTNTPANVKRIFSDLNSNLYYITSDGIYISKDEGESFSLWSPLPNSGCNYYVSSFQHLFAYKNSVPAIYQSVNALAGGTLVTGYVYSDNNNDCINDLNELKKEWIMVSSNGANSFNTFSVTNGAYNLWLPKGDYSIAAETPNNLFEACSQTNISIVNQDTIKLDLGLKSKEVCPYLEVNFHVPILRVCSSNLSYVRVCNVGSADAVNTKVKIQLDDALKYYYSDITPISIDKNELTVDIGLLPADSCIYFAIGSILDCSAVIGQTVCSKVIASADNKCATNLPDISEVERCGNVISSYDPNDKTAFINGIPANGKTEMNQEVEYLIRFQNTGTDTAFRIVVVDEIPKGYDITTLKPVNSSHPVNIQIENERRVKFIFDPIALPDSNINELASHGFVAFKISPNKDLPYGTKLDNKADIYFDFNDAVTTNTAFLTVTKTTSTSEQKDNLNFNYYPNPTKGELNIEVKNDKSQTYTLKVTDLLGKELVKEVYKGQSFKMFAKNTMLPGIYFMSIEEENGRKGYGKFVVQR